MAEFGEEGLTAAQRKVTATVRPLFQPPEKGARGVILKLTDGLKERFGIANYVTQARVKGGLGDELKIYLGGIDLSSYLPPDVHFRGLRLVVENPPEEYFDTTANHHYNPADRQIGLIVEIAKGSTELQRPIQSTKHNGLIILHEMGHAWSDYHHPQDRVNAFTRQVSKSILNSVTEADVREWFTQAEADTRRLGKYADTTVKADSVRRSFRDFLRHEADKLNDKQDSVRGLVTPGVGWDLTEQIIRELDDYLASQLSGSSSWYDVRRLIQNAAGRERVNHDEYRKKYVREAEYRAWNWEEEAAARLKRDNPRIRLWDGDKEELILLLSYFVLHHPELSLEDIKDERIRRQLRGIPSPKAL